MLKPFRQASNKKANTYDMLNQILFTNRCDDYELFKEKIQFFFYYFHVLLSYLLFITVTYCFQKVLVGLIMHSTSTEWLQYFPIKLKSSTEKFHFKIVLNYE